MASEKLHTFFPVHFVSVGGNDVAVFFFAGASKIKLVNINLFKVLLACRLFNFFGRTDEIHGSYAQRPNKNRCRTERQTSKHRKAMKFQTHPNGQLALKKVQFFLRPIFFGRPRFFGVILWFLFLFFRWCWCWCWCVFWRFRNLVTAICMHRIKPIAQWPNPDPKASDHMKKNRAFQWNRTFLLRSIKNGAANEWRKNSTKNERKKVCIKCTVFSTSTVYGIPN